MSQLVTIQPKDWTVPTSADRLEAFVPLVLTQMERGLPAFLKGNAERLIRCVLTAVRVNPSLVNCTPLSLFATAIQAGQLGFELGGPLGLAFPIPYGKECTLQLGYKGLLQLGYRSTLLKRCTPRKVRDGDRFEVYEGTDQRIVHVPLRNNRKPVTDYYVTTELVNGGIDHETFTVEDAILFRDRYASARQYKKGPWYIGAPEGHTSQEFDEMAMKTLIRKLFKRLPVSVEAQRAAALDEAAELGLPQQLGAAMLPEFAGEPSATERMEETLGRQQAEPVAHAPPAAKKAGTISKLLDQLEKVTGDSRAPGEWIGSVGYGSQDEIEKLSAAKKMPLIDNLQKKLRELGEEPAA